jgi:hypothetical protein
MACHHGLAEMRRGYVAESLGVQGQRQQIDRYLPSEPVDQAIPGHVACLAATARRFARSASRRYLWTTRS